MSDSDITAIPLGKVTACGYLDDEKQKLYDKLRGLLDNGQKEEVINELKDIYREDSEFANSLAKCLNIVYYYKDSNYSIIAQNTQDDNLEITTEYYHFHNILEVIQNSSQYQGNLADTLFTGISGIFNSMATLAGKTKERIA